MRFICKNKPPCGVNLEAVRKHFRNRCKLG
jgi:hypothetical protein